MDCCAESPPLSLALSAGEASGDHLAAALARALLRSRSDIRLAGIAGPRMRASGVQAWLDSEDLAVMGLVEIIRHLPRLYRLRRHFRQRVLAAAPNAFVGIDAPEFNLGLARDFRRRGLFTAHVVSPSVWAWRAGRIPGIAASLDLLLTLFPFEPALYADTGLDCRFIGHPMADELARAPDREDACNVLGLNTARPVITLLPGSRRGELARHLQIVADTATRLRADRSDLQLVLALADAGHAALITPEQHARLDAAGVSTVCGRTRTAIAACTVALAASGTVTLECLLSRRPMVVFYRLATATYHTARLLRLVRSRWVALPNLLAGDDVVPERLQHDAQPGRLARDLLDWLDHDRRRADFIRSADAITGELARDAGRNAATALLERLDERL